jgi:hypothetical protein
MGTFDDSRVRLIPAMRTPTQTQTWPQPTSPEPDWRRRALAVWVLAGVAVLALVAVALLVGPPPSSPSATAPGASPSVGTSMVLGAAGGVDSTGASPPSTAGAGVPRMRVDNLTATNRVTSWDVTVTIGNPAQVQQDWRNVSVQMPQGATLRVAPVTQGTNVYQKGQTVCVEPTAASPVAANGTVDIQFRVTGVLSASPAQAQLDDPTCAAAQ